MHILAFSGVVITNGIALFASKKSKELQNKQKPMHQLKMMFIMMMSCDVTKGFVSSYTHMCLFELSLQNEFL